MKSNFPLLLTVTKQVGNPQNPTLKDIVNAEKSPITTFNITDIGIMKEWVGNIGSPTKVESTEKIKLRKSGKKIVVRNRSDMDQSINEIKKILKSEGIIEKQI